MAASRSSGERRDVSSPAAGADPLLLHSNQQQEESHFSGNESLRIFTKYVLLRLLTFAFYVLDILSDANAAYGDYKAGDPLFAYITLGLVFAPGVLFSIYLFFDYLFTYIGEIACLRAPLSLLVSPLMPLWIVLRDLGLIICGIMATFSISRRARLLKHLSMPSRTYLLKFLEAFTEAAPQLLVRLFRLASRSPRPFSDLRNDEIVQIAFSLIILSVKVVSTHQKSVSTEQVIEGGTEMDSKYTLPWYLQIPAILWWLCFLASRFEALTLFTASYDCWVLLVIGIHVLLICLFQTIADRKDRLKRIFIYLFGSFVFIFAYVQFNLKTRVKLAVWFPYLAFTLIVFVENSVMLTFWFFEKLSSRPNDPIPTILTGFNESSVWTTFTGNSTISRSAPLDEELQCYWKLLLYIHYSLFGVGLLFMIAVFWGISVSNSSNLLSQNPSNDVKDKGKQTASEMQDLTHTL